MRTIKRREGIKARKRERMKALTYEYMDKKGKTLSCFRAFMPSRLRAFAPSCLRASIHT